MPEKPDPKFRPHVQYHPPEHDPAGGVAYAELQITSNFSFLRGGSHPEELVTHAKELGMRAVSVTDWNTLAGIVRAHVAAKEVGIQCLVGCRLEFEWQWQLGEKDNHGEIPPPPAGASRVQNPNRLKARLAYGRGLKPTWDAMPPEIPAENPAPKTEFPGTGPARPNLVQLLVYPTDRASYGRLCRLLTLGKRRSEKGECRLTWSDVIEHNEGLLAILILPAGPFDRHWWGRVLHDVREVFDDDRLSLAITHLYEAAHRRRFEDMVLLARELDVPPVATNDVCYHVASRRALQDVLTCVRLGCTIHDAGPALHANTERHLKPPAEMARLFADVPEAIDRTVEIARRAAGFSLDDIKYQYPHEVCPPGKSQMEYLRELTWTGAREKYVRSNWELGNGNCLAAGADAPLQHIAMEDSNQRQQFPIPNSQFPSAPLCRCGKPATGPCDCIPPDVRKRLDHEFHLIEELNYPAYFLTVYDIVRFARSQGILCQGRGAAANSAVCFCLGITSVDPARIDLLVERFISKERDEPPDIDIDFEHERREEVIQYIYRRFGRERAALTAEVISYRRRSAVREVGKVMGLSLDCVDRLAKSHDWWEKEVIGESELLAMGLDPRDKTIRKVARLAKDLLGFPRHLSQHVGGFVITEGLLCELVPIENAAMDDRTVIEWDKDDIDAMGMLKIDVLGLGMMTAISKALKMMNDWTLRQVVVSRQAQRGMTNDESRFNDQIPMTRQEALPVSSMIIEPSEIDSSFVASSFVIPSPSLCTYPLELHSIPAEDPVVYDMLCRADSVGVFQVESRAQMSMLPRLRPRCFYDLVIEVAIVRPGPIQGGMVHPFLKRRCNEEPVTYPSDAVKSVLERTLGVPLFQEQVMRLAMVAAGFTGGEADQLRRAMAAWKRKGHLITRFVRKITEGMLARGYLLEYTQRVCEQIHGFGEYGFPESHAASFALLVYASAWLKCYHPAAFCAALINSQPMGFYQPAQLVRDAREHHVPVLPVDVNDSVWDCTLEDGKWEMGNGNCLPALPASHAISGIGAHENAPANSHFPLPNSTPALRLGLRLVRSLRQPEAEKIVEAVARNGTFTSIVGLWRASGVKVSTLRKLAEADAFTSMGLDRQQATWEITRLRDDVLPLLETGEDCQQESRVQRDVLPPVPVSRMVVQDYGSIGMSLRAHPIGFVREKLRAHGFVACGALKDPAITPQNHPAAVAGLVLVRQRPGTASGIIFVTLEDETGVANLVVRPHVYERFKHAIRGAVALAVWGHVERVKDVVHLIVRRAADVNSLDAAPSLAMSGVSRDFH